MGAWPAWQATASHGAPASCFSTTVSSCFSNTDTQLFCTVPCRLYQQITAQQVVCQQYNTQAACQSTPPSAQLQCAWDQLNSRCMADPYASLLMPLSCAGSKARSFMTCGRKGAINACRTDSDCVLGKQARCFPAWLVSEARAKNTTEQDIAEATAVALLKGTFCRTVSVAAVLVAWRLQLLNL